METAGSDGGKEQVAVILLTSLCYSIRRDQWCPKNQYVYSLNTQIRAGVDYLQLLDDVLFGKCVYLLHNLTVAAAARSPAVTSTPAGCLEIR